MLTNNTLKFEVPFSLTTKVMRGNLMQKTNKTTKENIEIPIKVVSKKKITLKNEKIIKKSGIRE